MQLRSHNQCCSVTAKRKADRQSFRSGAYGYKRNSPAGTEPREARDLGAVEEQWVMQIVLMGHWQARCLPTSASRRIEGSENLYRFGCQKGNTA